MLNIVTCEEDAQVQIAFKSRSTDVKGLGGDVEFRCRNELEPKAEDVVCCRGKFVSNGEIVESKFRNGWKVGGRVCCAEKVAGIVVVC